MWVCVDVSRQEVLNIILTSFRRRVDSLSRETVQMYHAEPAENDRELEFIPLATDRPVGLDLDEFLPVRLLLI